MGIHIEGRNINDLRYVDDTTIFENIHYNKHEENFTQKTLEERKLNYTLLQNIIHTNK